MSGDPKMYYMVRCGPELRFGPFVTAEAAFRWMRSRINMAHKVDAEGASIVPRLYSYGEILEMREAVPYPE